MRMLIWVVTYATRKIRWCSKSSFDFYCFYVVIVVHEGDFK